MSAYIIPLKYQEESSRMSVSLEFKFIYLLLRFQVAFKTRIGMILLSQLFRDANKYGELKMSYSLISGIYY